MKKYDFIQKINNFCDEDVFVVRTGGGIDRSTDESSKQNEADRETTFGYRRRRRRQCCCCVRARAIARSSLLRHNEIPRIHSISREQQQRRRK